MRHRLTAPTFAPLTPIELKPLGDGEFANLRWHGEGEQLVTPQWLIKNLLPETGVALLSGQWGTGKTFVALDAAVSVMIGAQFATYRCKRSGGVLYIAAEGGSQIPIRLAAILEKKCPLHRGPLPFAWLDYCPPFTPGAGEVGLLQFAEEAARRMWEKHGVPLVLIIIDTLAAAARFKDENAAAEVQQAMDVLNAISRATGALVLAVDHFGKAAETGTRGSSAKEASADAVIACVAERTNSGTISNTRIAVRKLRGGATGAETAFTLSVEPMGVDEDGDPISTCVVAWSPVTIAAPPETAKGDGWPKTTTARLWRACLLAALNQYGSQQVPFPDHPAVRAASLENVRAEFDLRSPLDRSLDRAKEMDKRRKAFRRGMEAVRAKEKIEIREINGVDWVWLTDQALVESQPHAPQRDNRPEQCLRESGHQGGHRTPP